MDAEDSAIIHNCAFRLNNLRHQRVSAAPTKLPNHSCSSRFARIKRTIHSKSRRHVRWCSRWSLNCLVSPALGPFTFFFAFLFGVFVDVFLFIFKINGSPQGVNRNRLMPQWL